jgi:PAS domain S-box-containing protein
MTAIHSATDSEGFLRFQADPGIAGLNAVPGPEFTDLAALAAQICGTRSAALAGWEGGVPQFLGRHEFPADAPGFAAWLERCSNQPAAPGELAWAVLPEFGFVAGVSLAVGGTAPWGMLCVADPEARELGPDQRAGLARLARQAARLLELGRASRRWEQAAQFAGATIDALKANLCVLDEHGNILATNASWERFARRNSPPEASISSGGGGNYLDVCEQATGVHSEGAAQFAQGIRAVIRGEQPAFTAEYPCHSPTEQRWFLAQATRVGDGAPVRVVMAHEDISERRRVQRDELTNKSALLQAIMDTSVAAITGVDLAGRIIYANPQAEKVLGLTRAALLRREYNSPEWHTTAPDGGPLPDELQPFRRVLASGAPVFDVEHAIDWPDGRRHQLSINGAPIKNDRGEITSLVFSINDITERKEAEQAIRDEQVINRTLLENLAAIFFVFNREGKILRWNHALEVELGVSGDQLRASHPLDFVVPADRSVAEQGIRRTFEEGHAQVELYLLGREGRSDPFYVVTRAVELDGEPVLVGLGFDLRERREAEAEIRRLAAFPGLNPEPVLEFADDGSLRYRNQASDALALALGAGDFARLLPPAAADIVRECLASGQPRLRLETVFGDHTLSWSFFPISDQQRVHGYVSDITERVLQEMLARRSQRLESIGTLAGGIAHDLNNTLTPITMGIQMFRHEHPGQSELAEAIEQSALRAASMVWQLVTFAKGAGGRRVGVDPRHLVRDLKQIIGSTFPKNIQLGLEVAEHLPGLVGDHTQLHQVLLNLCVNARDAMPQGGTLTLAGFVAELTEAAAARILDARPGRFVVLRVTDTGTGIDPAHLERIFDPFFTTKGADQGTGLGLANALAIIKGHNGFIHVRSQPGLGSNFEVYLPAVDGAVPVAEDSARSLQLPQGAGQTILFVDDEKPVAHLAGRLLTRLGYHPLVAHCAAEGLQHLQQRGGEIVAIITDLQMPGMDGLEFARAARVIRATVPILVASGRLDDSVAESFQQLGVHLRLDKPFTAPQFAELLSAALKGPTNGDAGGGTKRPATRPRSAPGGPQQLQIFPHA